jgi:hypothetical protein
MFAIISKKVVMAAIAAISFSPTVGYPAIAEGENSQSTVETVKPESDVSSQHLGTTKTPVNKNAPLPYEGPPPNSKGDKNKDKDKTQTKS